MAQVHVFNANEYPYKEKFNDRWVEIGAKERITMDADEAKRFLARCNGKKVDADGQPDPSGFKRLFIEPIAGQVEAPSNLRYVSHIDGKEFTSKKALEEHLKQFKDKVVTDERAEQEMQERKGTTRTRKSAQA